MLHAPIINFNPSIALKNHIGKQVLGEDEYYTMSDTCYYDEGSFRFYKKQFFQRIIGEKKITHTLSGHSHRSALYYCSDLKKETSYGVGSILTCSYQGFPLEEANNPQEKIGSLTRFIVTGSAGPLSNINQDNVLGGVGVTAPTGTLLFFSETGDTLKSIKAKCKTAKPRLAALLDYYDVQHSEKGFYQPKAQSLDTFHAYHFDCDLAWPQNAPLFSEAVLFVYRKGHWINCQAELKKIHASNFARYILKFENRLIDFLSRSLDEMQAMILSFKFNSALSSVYPYENYDLSTPWQFPVEFIISGIEESQKKPLYTLCRPIRSKDRPNFDFYKKLYSQSVQKKFSDTGAV
jgi:hypothetical protein